MFDKSIPVPLPPLPVHAPIHKIQKSKLKKALSRTGSLDVGSRPVPSKMAPISRGKLSKIGKVPGGHSRASKAGLFFPVGRIKRMLK